MTKPIIIFELKLAVKPDGINLDYDVDPLWAKKKLRNTVIQGGLDPKILLKSDKDKQPSLIPHHVSLADQEPSKDACICSM